MSAELALPVDRHAAAPIIAAPKVEPCYACAERACAEEITYPADMLAWSWQTGKFHCEHCFDEAPEQLGEPGPSLEWCLEQAQKKPLLAARPATPRGPLTDNAAGGVTVTHNGAGRPKED